jgi:hypothetical protein
MVRPWKADHFKHALHEAVKAAALSGLSFHGLRKGLHSALAQGVPPTQKWMPWCRTPMAG